MFHLYQGRLRVSDTKLYRALQSFAAPDLKSVRVGDIVAADDPVMSGRERLFEEVKVPDPPKRVEARRFVKGSDRVNEVKPSVDPNSRRADVRRMRAMNDYSSHTPEQVAQEAVDAATQAGIDVSELESGPGDAPVVPAAAVVADEGLDGNVDSVGDEDNVKLAKDDIDPDDDLDAANDAGDDHPSRGRRVRTPKG